ncbi:MAG: coproporphyrinogen dehydrogenase HemZ [Ruminococcus sp.]|nr:coproporphyrinogen dehydrogenase HemZ [Ruminococcus sp.]
MKQDFQYALIFKGHSFEYEVQAIAKLFIPVRFQLCQNGNIPENIPNRIYTEISLSDNSDSKLQILIIKILLHGMSEEVTQQVSKNLSEEDLEYIFCKLLYTSLKKLTGYQPPWGMLTGIRPVRKVLQELDNNFTPEQACKNLQEKYFISDEKIKLACDVALIQKPILLHSAKEIGLYIAIPFCPTRCSYCSFVSHSMDTAKQLIPDYILKLCEEIAILGQIIKKFHLSVQSIYIGGGTPTAISAEQLRRVMQAIENHIDIQHVKEYTVEAGRADTITEEKLQVIKTMHATRISVNPQTLQDNVLQAIGRCHTAQQVIDVFLLARKLGFTDINMDLIAGLPTDTYEGFSNTLRRVIALQPDSITVHALTLKRSADLYGYKQNTEISVIEQMAKLSAKLLPENDYQPYYLYRQKNTIGNLENVGYARSGKENLYNILIMDETQTILGAGCSASSKIVNNTITRVMNYKFPYEYINRFDELMLKKNQIIAELEKL